ncbi:MAG: hypothetical protein AAGF45_08365 [Pseudomonadota bacterium]
MAAARKRSLEATFFLAAGVAAGIFFAVPDDAPLWQTLLAGFLGGLSAQIIITIIRRLRGSGARERDMENDDAADQ